MIWPDQLCEVSLTASWVLRIAIDYACFASAFTGKNDPSIVLIGWCCLNPELMRDRNLHQCESGDIAPMFVSKPKAQVCRTSVKILRISKDTLQIGTILVQF